MRRTIKLSGLFSEYTLHFQKLDNIVYIILINLWVKRRISRREITTKKSQNRPGERSLIAFWTKATAWRMWLLPWMLICRPARPSLRSIRRREESERRKKETRFTMSLKHSVSSTFRVTMWNRSGMSRSNSLRWVWRRKTISMRSFRKMLEQELRNSWSRW